MSLSSVSSTLPVERPTLQRAPEIAIFAYLGQGITLDPADFAKYVEDRKTLNLMLARLDAQASQLARASSDRSQRALRHSNHALECELRAAVGASS